MELDLAGAAAADLMKAVPRRVRMVIVGLIVAGLGSLSWFSFTNLLAAETTGLDYVGVAVEPPTSSLPPGATEAEFRAHWYTQALFILRELPLDKIIEGSQPEAYRFWYEPSFHPKVCVTIWREADRCWLRTSVLRWDETQQAQHLWQKTRPLSEKRWNRMQSLFRKRTVMNPLDGQDSPGGIDGSSWSLESFVEGRSVRTDISNPVHSFGFPHCEIVSPSEPRLKDFVATCLLMLDWSGVRVPEMY